MGRMVQVEQGMLSALRLNLLMLRKQADTMLERLEQLENAAPVPAGKKSDALINEIKERMINGKRKPKKLLKKNAPVETRSN